MITNHHIAMQFAAERQRELRASSGGFRLADLWARWSRRRLPGRGDEGQALARGTDAVVLDRPVSTSRVTRQPELRASRSIAGSGVRHARRRQAERRREHTRS